LPRAALEELGEAEDAGGVLHPALDLGLGVRRLRRP
jgi:hypothetical protein